MKALIKYTTHSHGCQNGSNWSSAGKEEQVVEFIPNENYTNQVLALKALKQPFQFGNSFTYMCNFEVTILEV